MSSFVEGRRRAGARLLCTVTAVLGTTSPVARRRYALRARLQALRARHEWLDHLVRAGARYVAQRGNHFAAAITFFSVLTAVPLLMVAFAAAGYVLWFNPELLARLERSVAAALPTGLGEALDPVLQTAIAQRNTVAGVGLVAALWSGVWWMSNVREAVSAQWALPAPNPAALQRLLHDLVALVGLGAALLASLAVTVVGSGLAATVLDLVGAIDDGVNRALLRASAVLIGLVANWLILLWAITRLPRTDVPTRGAARAALLGAVALEVLKQGTALYFERVTTSASGAVFGSLLGLLLFSYVVARLLLLVTAWAATARGNERPVPVTPPAPAVLRPVVVRPEPLGAPAVGVALVTGLLLGAWLRGAAQRSNRGRKGT
jgi:membrane protein